MSRLARKAGSEGKREPPGPWAVAWPGETGWNQGTPLVKHLSYSVSLLHSFPMNDPELHVLKDHGRYRVLAPNSARETSIVWWVVLNILKTSQRQLQGQRWLALLPLRILSFKPGLSKYFSIFPIYSKLSTQIHPWSVWVRKELCETVDWSVGATGSTRRHTGCSWVHSSSVTEMAVLMSKVGVQALDLELRLALAVLLWAQPFSSEGLCSPLPSEGINSSISGEVRLVHFNIVSAEKTGTTSKGSNLTRHRKSWGYSCILIQSSHSLVLISRQWSKDTSLL